MTTKEAIVFLKYKLQNVPRAFQKISAAIIAKNLTIHAKVAADKNEEKECYKLVEESTKLLYGYLDFCIFNRFS